MKRTLLLFPLCWACASVPPDPATLVTTFEISRGWGGKGERIVFASNGPRTVVQSIHARTLEESALMDSREFHTFVDRTLERFHAERRKKLPPLSASCEIPIFMTMKQGELAVERSGCGDLEPALEASFAEAQKFLLPSQ